MNRGTGGVQFASERVVIAVCAMVRLGVRVRCGPHMLKTRFRQRRLVCRKGMVRRPAGGEENKGDECRENG